MTGYEESGKLHPRVSLTVTPEYFAQVALARPRPPGQDSPQAYRYQAPAGLHDGIAAGDISQSELGTATADAIVRGVLDGTYKDVHSVLLYQHGHLVMEEYFYGRLQHGASASLAGIAVDRGALSGVHER